MQPTSKPITVGRIVHVYSDSWTGPRAGIVSNAFRGSSHANINVFFDGVNDQRQLGVVRESPSGNTLGSVQVLDVDWSADPQPTVEDMLTLGSVDSNFSRVVAVWPPRS